MPLRKLPFLKDNIYHVFSRGNRKETIFLDEKSYLRFLIKIEEYGKRYGLDIIAYCLLSNHFHLLVKQLTDIPVSRFMGTLLSSLSHYSAVRYELPQGHFFQGRFGAKLIETPESLLQVSRYIHLNPVKEDVLKLDFTYKSSRLIRDKSVIERARKYPYSSYQFYLNPQLPSSVTVNTDYIRNIEETLARYRGFVESKITDEDVLNLERF